MGGSEDEPDYEPPDIYWLMKAAPPLNCSVFELEERSIFYRDWAIMVAREEAEVRALRQEMAEKGY